MDDYQKFLNKTLRFLAYRSRSEREVLGYLQKKEASHKIQEAILAFLKDRRFVNDKEFATNWIEQRLRTRPKSMRMLKLELKNKGISEEVAMQAIANFKVLISNEGDEMNVSDLETAKKLVKKKIDKYSGLSKQEIYQKLGGFLGRKGFDWETIKKAIDYEVIKE
jgi:regulatory protein